ncbi:MAG: galactokinase [Ginsengibacter sp.]
MNIIAANVNSVFRENFSPTPDLYYSPGRINFIGEHVDYNDGFVMPAAIDKGIYYAIELNNTDELNFYSIDFKERLTIRIADIKKLTGWKNYVLSIANEFVLGGFSLRGFDCVFGGNIPNGAGMSSSAAVEGGLAFAINELFHFGISRKKLALLCQRAEHNFPGVQVGIMDMYANMMGKKNNVILLDCRSIEHQYFPIELSDYKIVLINSNVHHSLASSEYNVRRKQCEEGLRIMKEEKNINSFRDIKKAEDLLPFKSKMGEKVYMRCLYVVQEIYRTQQASKLLQQSNLLEFGKLMFATHEGLSNLYQVSCNELDFLVELAKQNTNVIGARMMGGGFGGCTINIIKEEAIGDFLSSATVAYQKKFQVDPEVFEVSIVDGTHEISDLQNTTHVHGREHLAPFSS